MLIKTELKKDVWFAEFEEAGWTSSVGTGQTEAMAVACLFYRNKNLVHNLIVKDPVLSINGAVWTQSN